MVVVYFFYLKVKEKVRVKFGDFGKEIFEEAFNYLGRGLFFSLFFYKRVLRRYVVSISI